MATTGLDALLTPDNHTLLLIDHQAFQLATVGSADQTQLVSNTIGLAKTAKVFGVPTILTTVVADRGGRLFDGLQSVFPDQKPIDRTFINTWQDPVVVAEVAQVGRRKLVIAGLWTEVCVAMPALQALGEGYEVYVVTDASAGVSVEAHERSVQRMVQAGVVPITWIAYASELQRDWARTGTAAQLVPAMAEHAGSIGVAMAWEFQLLATPAPSA